MFSTNMKSHVGLSFINCSFTDLSLKMRIYSIYAWKQISNLYIVACSKHYKNQIIGTNIYLSNCNRLDRRYARTEIGKKDMLL